MRPALVLIVIALGACSDATSPNPFARATGTYSEYMIDNRQLPFATPNDTCQIVNAGGWLTLTIDRKYAMLWDRMTLLCNGVYSGSSAVGQTGTYQFENDTLIVFTPAPSYAPPFIASFDPGNYTPSSGGTVPSLRFSFAGHDYWAIEDVPFTQRRR